MLPNLDELVTYSFSRKRSKKVVPLHGRSEAAQSWRRQSLEEISGGMLQLKPGFSFIILGYYKTLLMGFFSFADEFAFALIGEVFELVEHGLCIGGAWL